MKRFSITAFILLYLIPFFCLAQTEDNLEAGLRAMRLKDMKTARTKLEAAYKASPKDTAVILNLAEVYMLTEEYSKAEKVLNSAAKVYPDNGAILLRLGITQNLRSRWRKSQESFQKASQHIPLNAPERSTLYINYGLSVMNDDKPLEALPWFDKALELNPRNATALAYKGASYYLMSEYFESIASFSAALDIDNTNSITYYNRGMAYLRAGDTQSGCQDFHTACRMGNQNACKAIVTDCTNKN